MKTKVILAAVAMSTVCYASGALPEDRGAPPPSSEPLVEATTEPEPPDDLVEGYPLRDIYRLVGGMMEKLNWYDGHCHASELTPEQLESVKLELRAIVECPMQPRNRKPDPAEPDARAINREAEIVGADAKQARAESSEPQHADPLWQFMGIQRDALRWANYQVKSVYTRRVVDAMIRVGVVAQQTSRPPEVERSTLALCTWEANYKSAWALMGKLHNQYAYLVQRGGEPCNPIPSVYMSPAPELHYLWGSWEAQ
ncbi:MAG: hypothetical protein LBJ69_02960 [Holosporales bacterium]|jgi:hypothetical protein|nr:hypothetical protein [Holosporales bacterium]